MHWNNIGVRASSKRAVETVEVEEGEPTFGEEYAHRHIEREIGNKNNMELTSKTR